MPVGRRQKAQRERSLSYGIRKLCMATYNAQRPVDKKEARSMVVSSSSKLLFLTVA